MTGLTAEEFKARNGRTSVIDEMKQKDADMDAWSMWLAAAELCKRSDLQLACEAKSYIRDTIAVLTKRLEKMK